MSVQHSELAGGRWKALSFTEQMANVGSEVERARKWREKGNTDYSRLALERALELIDLTLGSVKGYGRLRELARVREGLVDYFLGENEYASTGESWSRYFAPFAFAARRSR
jgi:hypothetical protein